MRSLQDFARDTARVVTALDDAHLVVLCLVLKTTLIARGISTERGLVHVVRQLEERAGTAPGPEPIHGDDCTLPPE